jgi:hypothetical protein
MSTGKKSTGRAVKEDMSPFAMFDIPVDAWNKPLVKAADALDTYACRLLAVAEMPAALYETGLYLINGFGAHIYCFEQSSRWPDGKYHMLDRDYEAWRDHNIAFTKEELEALGVIEWYKATDIAYTGGIWPMQADDFPRFERYGVPQYARLVARIANACKASAIARHGYKARQRLRLSDLRESRR